MYARGINDSSLKVGEDRFIHVVSCNTHNLCSIVDNLSLNDGKDNLIEGRFNFIRRSNDVSQSSKFVPAPQVGRHQDKQYGTHHARDAVQLFKTVDLDLNLFSSAMIVNSQYMHILHFHLKNKKSTTIQNIIDKMESNDLIATTDKVNANEVFSFGRDHGHFGRILNQAVVSVPSLNVRNKTTA
jgi:glyceraldehyde-3-phosphate dehydrogenase (NAD(P))